jgi:hypothetical protein
MGALRNKHVAKLGSRTIEVRGKNHILRGLIYTLLFDSEEAAFAQNFWKIPTRRSLEARVSVDGAERHIVVSVTQRMLSCDFSLTIDGGPVPLESVK